MELNLSEFSKDAIKRELIKLKEHIMLLEEKKKLNSIENENIELKNKLRQLESQVYVRAYGMSSESPVEKEKEKIQSPTVEIKQVNFDVDQVKLQSELAYYKSLVDTKQPIEIHYAKKTEISYKDEYLKVKQDFQELLELYNEKPIVQTKELCPNWEEKELSNLNKDVIRIRAARDTFKSQYNDVKNKMTTILQNNNELQTNYDKLNTTFKDLEQQYILAQMQVYQFDEQKFNYWSKKCHSNGKDMDIDHENISCRHEQWISDLKEINIPHNEVAQHLQELIQKYSAGVEINKSLTIANHKLEVKVDKLSSSMSQLYKQLQSSQTQKQEEIEKLAKLESEIVKISSKRDSNKNAMLASDHKCREYEQIVKLLEEKLKLTTELNLELEKNLKEADYRFRPKEVIEQHKIDGLLKEIEELKIKLIDSEENFRQCKEGIKSVKYNEDRVRRHTLGLETRLKIITSNIERCGGDMSQLEQIQGAEAVEELERYKNILKCSACMNNFKSHVITSCWHIFCEECIKSRIETRQRKCPTCQIPFGQENYKPLYF